jgi:uncharacterized protein YegP (UPF0339 family)
MAMKYSKFEVFKGKNGRVYFRLRSRSGEIILGGQGYRAPWECRRGIAAVKANARLAKRYLEKTAKNGQSYFVLIAGNNHTIGKSELYRTRQALKRGIQAVRKAAPTAVIK